MVFNLMPGAMPQAKSCTAPLALNTSVAIYAMRFATLPKTFPVRFGDKFGKLSAGAKTRDCTYTRRCFAGVSQAFFGRAWR